MIQMPILTNTFLKLPLVIQHGIIWSKKKSKECMCYVLVCVLIWTTLEDNAKWKMPGTTDHSEGSGWILLISILPNRQTQRDGKIDFQVLPNEQKMKSNCDKYHMLRKDDKNVLK